ncbi:SDR family oxidoreductase [Szabonella alba]|uniref:SDR family oxidoreductase n=1 Tax=Szabonella alba TaxID=2804194 RepID=A0A8K0Y1S4_9RHOB|nr:SDR family oxidoreductase [Szabonella alba]MBL4919201.1 SDR family oxidoreductase [Szabonella alba]
MELEGKVCIVTGGASGIGRAVAALFARHGARVVIADANAEAAEVTAADLGAEAIRCNVAQEEDVMRVVDQTRQRHGRIDVLVNNAGYGFIGTVETIDGADWDRLMSVNLKGVFLCSKHVVPVMAAQGGGSIINTTSYTAQSAIANRAAYVASKGGVSALTRAMALDHVAQGIRVNAVAPGTVNSPYFDRIFNEAEDPAGLRAAYDARAAMGRMGRPDEIAEAFLFLASDRSRFATGSILTVDGGSSIGNHLVA